MSIRVRFAPSPTGHLHIGGARTALFNWLLARRKGGAFLLRIEDSDPARSRPEMTEAILESLRWLGLEWDEGPFFQSRRGELYRRAVQRLLQVGAAYLCFCPPGTSPGEESGASPESWQYPGTCRDLDPDQARARKEAGEPCVVRFRVPRHQTIRFEDDVFGPISVEGGQIEDFVLQRSDASPTYHLCVVADDIEMRITNVIRGADHLSNTAKHVLLFRALGGSLPRFAHLPLILGPDRKRLSKRHGATSVLEYRRAGYLPQALANTLALLGWSPGDEREVMSLEELAKAFEIRRVSKADAVFDPAKLEWMNARHLGRLPAAELVRLARPLLKSEGLWKPSWEARDGSELQRTLLLLQSRLRRLEDLVKRWRAFFSEDFSYEEEGIQRYLSPAPEERDSLIEALSRLAVAYRDLEPFDLQETERVLRAIAAELQVKTGRLIGALRVALTGRVAAPGIFDIVLTLGRQRTLERLERVLQFLT